MKILLAVTIALLSACSHEAVVPEAKNVKVARENPSADCTEIDRITGSVTTSTGKIEDAIEDMKTTAARRGANYVRMETTGAMGTTVKGTAFHCP